MWAAARAAALATALATGPSAALSHAAIVQAAPVQAVAVHATYDTGEPMAEAQITVFAPDNPAEPWLRGIADGEGRFVFVPDPIPGRWAIQARTAGHGAMAYVTLDAEAAEAAPLVVAAIAGGGIDPLQRWVMAAAVIWGFVGTAIYFRRRRG